MNYQFPIAGLALAMTVAAAGVLLPSEAEACGGLFCDTQQPVNQSAERIIFSTNPDDTVTAVVQILYEGPSEEFAWVLPVPSIPEVSVSSDLAFQRLQLATNPQYRMTTRVEGECRQRNRGIFGSAETSADSLNGAPGAPEDQGVSVLDSGVVGPYDFTVIEVQAGLPEPEEVALDWLDSNGYEVSALAPNVIRPYLEEGMFLIAFRLTKNTDAGDIRPVVLNYESDNPMIPIKLTAVAANDDMGVMTWVLGDHRAVPVNYKSLVLNEALINWFNPGSNYDAVVSAAADEAGGQGFATEMAGPTEELDELVWGEADEDQWKRIRERSHPSIADAVCSVWQSYGAGFEGTWDGWPETVNTFFSGLSAQARDAIVLDGCGSRTVPNEGEVEVFLDMVEENVIDPMRETQSILSGAPYFTRLYTTLSAAEMTVDPVFDYNPDLPDVSNRHEVERVIECSDDFLRSEAPWRVRLNNGMLVRGTGNAWPIAAGDVPATQFVTQDSTSGDAEIVTDNTRTISLALERNNDAVLSEVDHGCGCASAGGRFPVEFLLALVGLGAIRLRSRRN